MSFMPEDSRERERERERIKEISLLRENTRVLDGWGEYKEMHGGLYSHGMGMRTSSMMSMD